MSGRRRSGHVPGSVASGARPRGLADDLLGSVHCLNGMMETPSRLRLSTPASDQPTGSPVGVATGRTFLLLTRFCLSVSAIKLRAYQTFRLRFPDLAPRGGRCAEANRLKEWSGHLSNIAFALLNASVS